MKNSFETWDAVFGIIKAIFFGFTITSVACYQGYFVEGGSEGSWQGDDGNSRINVPCRCSDGFHPGVGAIIMFISVLGSIE